MNHLINEIENSLHFNKRDILPIIISFDSSVIGNMITDNTIRIEGVFEGNLYSKRKIIIDDNAIFNGTIIAEDVDVSGKFNGIIFCTGKVVLKNGAEVIGRIHTNKFKNEEGSKFDDKLRLIKENALKKIVLLKEEIKPNAHFFESLDYKKLITFFSSDI